YSVCYSADGRWILGAGNTGRVRMWSVKTGEVGVKFKGATGEVVSAALSKDGTEVAACGPSPMTQTGATVWRLSAETGKALPAFTEANRNRASVALALVAPGAQRILTAGKRGAGKRSGPGTVDVAGSVIGSVVGTLAVNAMTCGGAVVVVSGGR